MLADVPVDHLRLGGGGSTDPLWRQLLADVLGLPLQAVDVPAAASRGAALLGAQAAELLNEQEPVASLVPVTELVASPQPDRVDYYNQRYGSYLDAVHALQPLTRQRQDAGRLDHVGATIGAAREQGRSRD